MCNRYVLSTYSTPGTRTSKQTQSLPSYDSGDKAGPLWRPQTHALGQCRSPLASASSRSFPSEQEVDLSNTGCKGCFMPPEMKSQEPEFSLGGWASSLSSPSRAPICHIAFCSTWLMLNNPPTTACNHMNITILLPVVSLLPESRAQALHVSLVHKNRVCKITAAGGPNRWVCL